MPRIFISYRRSDSGMFTGRIHDQLKAQFGASYVFRDMYNIPAGSDFRSVINKAVASTDVCLVIMGPKWVTVADAQGKRRLDDPNDFVRIEVEAALKNPRTRVIPVLVDNAVMPVAEELPPSLVELAYRNATQVRTDPDFPRDMEHLIHQLKHPEGKRITRSLWLVPLLLLLFLAGFFLLQHLPGTNILASILRLPATVTVANHPSDTPTATFLPSETVTVTLPVFTPTVEPVAPGEIRVLVAKMKQVGTQQGDVTVSPYNGLVSRFKSDPLFAAVDIREYPEVVESIAQAGEAAQQWGAALVLWGECDDHVSTIHLQLGALPPLPNLNINQEALGSMVNVTLIVNDEHWETLTYPMLSALGFLANAENDFLGTMRVILALGQVGAQPPEIPDLENTVAAHTHRATWSFLSNPNVALGEIDQAIKMEDQNPYLYIFRALIRQEMGDFRLSNEDLGTALLYSPKGWVMPYYIQGNESLVQGNESLVMNDLSSGENAYDTIIGMQPNEWLPYNQRGYLYFLNRDYDRAGNLIDTSIKLGPKTNWPYVWGILIAFRRGNLDDARTKMLRIAIMSRDINDPSNNASFVRSLLTTVYGKENATLLGGAIEATKNLSIRQFTKSAQSADEVLTSNKYYVEMYLLKGLSYCNTGDYREAEQAYSKGLEIDPYFATLYLLHAEVLKKLKDEAGAEQGFSTAKEIAKKTEVLENLSPFIEAIKSEQYSCEDMVPSIESLQTPMP